jgi:hypothetical protein
LSGQPASLKRGEFELAIVDASAEEMDGGPETSHCEIQSRVKSLGLQSQKLPKRAKWRFCKNKNVAGELSLKKA